MIIEFDENTRIKVTDEYYAPLKRKSRKDGDFWEEYKWFSSLEHCLSFLAQKSVSEAGESVSMNEYLHRYRITLQEFKEVVANEMNFIDNEQWN